MNGDPAVIKRDLPKCLIVDADLPQCNDTQAVSLSAGGMTSCQLIDVDEPDLHNDLVDSECEIVGDCDLIVEKCGDYDECSVRDDGDFCNEAEAPVTMNSDGAFMSASNQSIIECDPNDDISNPQQSIANGMYSEADVDIHHSHSVLSDHVLFCDDEQTGVTEMAEDDVDDSILKQHMEISEPLIVLQKLLETQLQCSLHDYEFWLQDTIQLDPSKNLVSQCIEGSGVVQINMEIKALGDARPRINIIDVLKPAEEVEDEQTYVSDYSADEPVHQVPSMNTELKLMYKPQEQKENVTRWIVDQAFRKEQERLRIPFDPTAWSNLHVRYWMQWAIKKFSLVGVNLGCIDLTGQQLVGLQHDDFVRYIPNDRHDIFWTHLELLRKCKFVAVLQKPANVGRSSSYKSSSHKTYCRKVRTVTMSLVPVAPGNKTASNSGQIQLWQFLLDLLTDIGYRSVIQWIGEEGEFKLCDPELVAQLWGQRKGKPTMNYEKLSRALRYYYDGDMISKVHGKRFVYKFVCDLRSLVGYSAAELNRLVLETGEQTGLQII